MAETNCNGCGRPAMLSLKALQHDVLEGLARDLPVEHVMDRLCKHAEQLAPDVVCSILTVDHEGRLHTLAAPSLPADYTAAIEGLKIGPSAGSCGTAAFLGSPVEVSNIAADPLWAGYKEFALPIGLRACWSTPIFAADGRVAATFAFYYRSCRGPSELDRMIVQACVNLCTIALIQSERKASIYRLAYFDSLTGVANRASFERLASDAIAAAAKDGSPLAVHWIDIDKFKTVNDTLGHCAGDALLKKITQRMAAILRPGEVIARMGGDEFAVLQPLRQGAEEAEGLALRLIGALSKPVDVEGAVTTVSASIGVAQAPKDGSSFPELMKKADLALYEAKMAGRGKFTFFNAEIEERVASRWRLEDDLGKALAADEFELHYQPFVDLESLTISGFEALLRWRRPRHGLLAPSLFLPAAEKDGLICDIGAWVLEEACRTAATLPTNMRMSVNLSPHQLMKPGFPLEVAATLAASGLSPHRLELEITESALLVESAATLACLNALRRLGISIALDDFGTGYSALSHLRAFPVDRIKIDRSFVQEADVRPETASIIRAIVGLARELGVRTTAEGVETQAHLRLLHSVGCDEIQGYLISKPKPMAAFDDYVHPLEARRRSTGNA